MVFLIAIFIRMIKQFGYDTAIRVHLCSNVTYNTNIRTSLQRGTQKCANIVCLLCKVNVERGMTLLIYI